MMRVSRALRAMFLTLSLTLMPRAFLIAQTSVDIQTVQGFFALVISDRESHVLAEVPLERGRFDHVFMHSAHLTPVVERFRVAVGPDGIPVMHLFELEYQSSGVGMPSDAEYGYRLIDGKFLLAMSREFAVIPLMVSIVPGHGVVMDGTLLAFTDLVPQETMLFLAIKSLL